MDQEILIGYQAGHLAATFIKGTEHEKAIADVSCKSMGPWYDRAHPGLQSGKRRSAASAESHDWDNGLVEPFEAKTAA